MENRAHALAAGLFALLLGAAAVLAVWWFSPGRTPMREVVLVARGDLNGLSQQARVRYRGLSVGSVAGIRIDPDDHRVILVRLRVPRDLPLTRGTHASLGSLGVTGLAFIQLDDRGNDPTPLEDGPDGPPRIELDPGVLNQISTRALAAVEQIAAVSNRIARVLDEDSVTRLRNMLARLESAAGGLDRGMAELPQILAGMRQLLAPDNVARLSALVANLERGSAEAAPVAAEFRALLGRVDQLVARLDQAAVGSSEGMLDGTLPQLNVLLRELAATSRRLGHLAEELESAPQMLITGRGAEPGPGEQGFGGR